jgi:sigma-E factor negative regulatory protein RseA
MSDEIREQISGFIDDELSAEECEFFVRRLQRDSASRSHYVRYQLIGAAIRGELGQPGRAGELRHRVRLALNGTRPQAARPEAPKPSSLGWLTRPAVGIGIAASVAAVAVLGLRFANGPGGLEGSGAAAVAAAATTDTALDFLSKPSYVVPLQTPEPGFVTPPIQLTKYLMQHGEYASPLTRTTVHLNVVSSAAEAMSEIEQGAPVAAPDAAASPAPDEPAAPDGAPQ